MACRLVGTKQLSEPILILKKVYIHLVWPWKKKLSQFFIQENPIQDVWKIAAIFVSASVC